MGVVKTASESILEETVVPSEEANYSLQGHAALREQSGRKIIEKAKSQHPGDVRCRDQGRCSSSLARSLGLGPAQEFATPRL
ncbi:hypothetical protein X777_05179 [Ooceraea biroi]|uniref:Uncharacterized protein n=1 Tax=Ooceraea biroi TaxID=2015173 RepID=A0A026WJE8_OOCBI|nr:hypothetical protein X777_05179 [Ooceraea biroi]